MSKKTLNVFGIRHLSPAGAYHLRKYLDEVKPEVVLVEGPSDANECIKYLTSSGTKPPVAILAYTTEIPVHTILYPFANYSPEYQAFMWARENNAHAEFIDLPTDIMIAIENVDKKETAQRENDDEVNVNEESIFTEESIYKKVVEISGEEDYESYWERNFEHNLNQDVYRKSVYEFSKNVRDISEEYNLGEKYHDAKNMVREAYMRYRINEVINQGYDVEKIVVVTGAYHASRIRELQSIDILTQKEIKKLPRNNTKLTLMPYSYYKLSSQSGYGAGNYAPFYYEMMWGLMCKDEISKLPAFYLSKVVENLRESGTYRSTAEVIEGVRLASALSAFKEGAMPVLKDLRDAAVICLGHGSLSVIAEAASKTEIGTAIGNLKEGVSQTPIQDDFNRELKRLKLEKYKDAVARDLELDLRENRRVKSIEAAFLDLNRSFFLSKLEFLGISFVKKKNIVKSDSNWAEAWILQWSPQAEIEIVESVLKGETIDLATAFLFKEKLDMCKSVKEAAKLVSKACECGMLSFMMDAKAVLQKLSVDSGSFSEIANAARELSIIIGYGDIRKLNLKELVPIMQELFLRAALIMVNACKCSSDVENEVIEAINDLNIVAMEHYDEVEEEIFIREIKDLSNRDDRNPRISGYATAILLERNEITNNELEGEVSRRLSPGIEADLGAGWFEGLAKKNRYALVSRMALWEQLEAYVSSLDDNQFKRALVFLRRAFVEFKAGEKDRIAEMLGEIWGVNSSIASEVLNEELSEEEMESLEELNEFDFEDM